MKKIDLGHTLGILANIGVIAGIIFLGIEIQQNTRSLEMSAYQELIGQINEFGSRNLDNPRIVLLARSGRASADLSADESIEVQAFFFLLTRHGDLAYYQYERGALSLERFESSLGPLSSFLCEQLYREFWKRESSIFVASFRQYIETRIGQC